MEFNTDWSRRSCLKSLATAGSTVTMAGCSAFRSSSLEPVTASTELSLSLDSNRLSQSEFEAATDDSRKKYGENGIWGVTESEPDHGLEYVGAWRRSKNGLYSNDEKAFESNHLVVLYRIPDLKLDGEQFYRAWLWSGATPNSEYRLDSIRPLVSLSRKSDDMRRYDPARTTSDGPVPVSFATSARDGPTVKFPLHAGKVEYAAKETKVGEAGSYGVSWTGPYDSTQGINATCVMKWPADRELATDWSVEVAASPK